MTDPLEVKLQELKRVLLAQLDSHTPTPDEIDAMPPTARAFMREIAFDLLNAAMTLEKAQSVDELRESVRVVQEVSAKMMLGTIDFDPAAKERPQ